MTNNKFVLDWINEMAEMTCPDQIVWAEASIPTMCWITLSFRKCMAFWKFLPPKAG